MYHTHYDRDTCRFVRFIPATTGGDYWTCCVCVWLVPTSGRGAHAQHHFDQWRKEDKMGEGKFIVIRKTNGDDRFYMYDDHRRALDTEHDAVSLAERLAAKSPTAKFFVARLVTVSAAINVETRRLDQ